MFIEYFKQFPLLNMFNTTGTIYDDEYRLLCLGGSDSVCYKHFNYYQMDGSKTEITSEAKAVDDNATTQFIDNGVVQQVQTPALTKVPLPITAMTQNMDQTIKDFLRKPIVFLDTTIAQNTISVLSRQDVTELVFNPLNPVWFAKTNGIFGMRFTTVFTMRINGSRFDSGLITMSFNPTCGVVNTGTLNTIRANSRIQLTAMSHVDFDINCDSAVTLKVPWVSSATMLVNAAPANRAGSPGELVTFVYGAYRSVTPAQTLRLTIYCHLEDVELFANTTYQMSGKKMVVRRDLLTQEENSDRPISGTLRALSTISGYLSRVPLLSSFMSTSSWVTDIASNAAYMYGFSAPRLEQPPHRVITGSAPYMTNFDKHSSSTSLGISIANKIDTSHDTFGTDMDEMSIDFVKAIPAFFASFSLTNAQADEAIIASYAIGPSTFCNSTVLTNTTRVIPTPIYFLSRLFRFWRGSIRLKFLLVKTEFHRCRLGFAFDPRSSSPTWDSTDPLLREIVDIREGRVIDMVIPYISSGNWQQFTGNIGTLYIYKLDDLRSSNDSTPTDIDILVEASGGDDFQLATKQNLSYQVGVLATFQMDGGTCDIVKSTLGSSAVVDQNYNHFGACIGEAFVSLSQLLKSGSSAGIQSAIRLRIYPHAIGVSALTNPLATDVNINNDTFSMIATMYGAMRGGIRIGVRPPINTPSTAVLRTGIVLPIAFITTQGVLSAASYRALTFNTTQMINSTNDSYLMFDVPQYNATPMMSTASVMVDTTGTAVASIAVTLPVGVVDVFNGTSATSLDYEIFRAVADDFRLGVFVAPPILYSL